MAATAMLSQHQSLMAVVELVLHKSWCLQPEPVPMSLESVTGADSDLRATLTHCTLIAVAIRMVMRPHRSGLRMALTCMESCAGGCACDS